MRVGGGDDSIRHLFAGYAVPTDATTTLCAARTRPSVLAWRCLLLRVSFLASGVRCRRPPSFVGPSRTNESAPRSRGASERDTPRGG